jgi:hypothetical protein
MESAIDTVSKIVFRTAASLLLLLLLQVHPWSAAVSKELH